MHIKKFLFILFCLSFNLNLLFTLSKKISPIQTNINSINTQTKIIIGILPFENISQDENYNFIGKIISKILYQDLSIINKITTKTNNKVFQKTLQILPLHITYKTYVNWPFANNLSFLSKKLGINYGILGSYTLVKKSKNLYKVKTKIYSAEKNKIIYTSTDILSHKHIEKSLKKISNKIINFFSLNNTGVLQIITNLTNAQIFINNHLIHSPLIPFLLPTGNYTLRITSYDNYTISTNIKISKNITNTYKFLIIKQKKLGVLNVNSSPTNAKVFLNIQFLGKTPLIATNIPYGKYRIKIIKTNFYNITKNISLTKKTNRYFFKLSQIPSHKKILKNKKKIKTIMYTTTGVGSSFLLLSYFFYSKADIEKDKFYLTKEVKYYYEYKTYYTLMDISLFTGLGNLIVGFVYFIKYLNFAEIYNYSYYFNFSTANNKINFNLNFYF